MATLVVRTAVKEHLNAILPGQIGPGRAWDEGFVNLLIDMVDREVREFCALTWVTQTIDLVDDTTEYELDSDLISIYRIEYTDDGTNYEYLVLPTTRDRLDSASRMWRDDTGTRPSHYFVHSAPGIPAISGATTSRVTLWPNVGTAGSGKIKVIGQGLTNVESAATARQHAVDSVYVPYVRSLLAASRDPDEGDYWYNMYLSGRDALRAALPADPADSEQRISGVRA